MEASAGVGFRFLVAVAALLLSVHAVAAKAQSSN